LQCYDLALWELELALLSLSNGLEEKQVELAYTYWKSIKDLGYGLKYYVFSDICYRLKQLTDMIILQEVCGLTLAPCCTISQIFQMRTL
jgi:hypothetical protein